MIKIIKPGKVIPVFKKIYKVTCPKCDCEFEFDDEEILGYSRHGKDYVICPNETCENIISKSSFVFDCEVKID